MANRLGPGIPLSITRSGSSSIITASPFLAAYL
ncbi:hypothetical protein HNP72_001275 [Sphingobacterium soli]|nr:hypothetical protein [Sphingobacterium soli]